MPDRRVLELVLISLLAAFGTGLAWALDHKLFAAAFAGAAVVADYAARSLAVKRYAEGLGQGTKAMTASLRELGPHDQVWRFARPL
jgi:hypothetical protein